MPHAACPLCFCVYWALLCPMSYVCCACCRLSFFMIRLKIVFFLCRNATVSDLVNVQHAIGIVNDPNAQSAGRHHSPQAPPTSWTFPSVTIRKMGVSFINHVSLSIFKFRFILQNLIKFHFFLQIFFLTFYNSSIIGHQLSP